MIMLPCSLKEKWSNNIESLRFSTRTFVILLILGLKNLTSLCLIISVYKDIVIIYIFPSEFAKSHDI